MACPGNEAAGTLKRGRMGEHARLAGVALASLAGAERIRRGGTAGDRWAGRDLAGRGVARRQTPPRAGHHGARRSAAVDAPSVLSVRVERRRGVRNVARAVEILQMLQQKSARRRK